MTENDWLRCTSTTSMVLFLKGKVSDRKIRLYLCAGARLHWEAMTDLRSRQAVEVSERFADGLVGRKEWAAARKGAAVAWQSAYSAWATDLGTRAGKSNFPALPPGEEDRIDCGRALQAAHEARLVVSADVFPCALGDTKDSAARADILRHLIGNPFRPVAIEPAWLAWEDGTVGKIAQAVYAERCFRPMPVLADALEEAGCTDADMLAHCRESGEHVRGCWVLDLLLGKV